jgi:hypothetical protein
MATRAHSGPKLASMQHAVKAVYPKSFFPIGIFLEIIFYTPTHHKGQIHTHLTHPAAASSVAVNSGNDRERETRGSRGNTFYMFTRIIMHEKTFHVATPTLKSRSVGGITCAAGDNMCPRIHRLHLLFRPWQ